MKNALLVSILHSIIQQTGQIRPNVITVMVIASSVKAPASIVLSASPSLKLTMPSSMLIIAPIVGVSPLASSLQPQPQSLATMAAFKQCTATLAQVHAPIATSI